MTMIGVALGTSPVDEILLPAAVSVGTYQSETKTLKYIETLINKYSRTCSVKSKSYVVGPLQHVLTSLLLLNDPVTWVTFCVVVSETVVDDDGPDTERVNKRLPSVYSFLLRLPLFLYRHGVATWKWDRV